MFAGFKPIKPLLHIEADKLSDEERYWNRLKEVSVFQESGNITCTDFLPVDPYFIASTCSSRLSIIDSKTCEPISTFNRIKSPLQCIAFRSDGNVAGVGTQSGQVHFFDVVRLKKKRGLKHPIRSFNNAHKHRINSLAFSSSNSSFVSLADDGIIKLWDLTDSRGIESAPIWIAEGAHADHIRSGVFSSRNDHFLVTGSYDHTVKVWDVRSKGDANASILEMDHGKPVEKVLLFLNETIVVSAGGNTIKLWDVAAGGKLLHTMENHYKTVTSMCFATNKNYLISGGLDRRINLFRCNSGDFALVKSWKVAAQVLSISMSPDDKVMAYGMSNLLSIHQRKTEKELAEAKNGSYINGDFFGEKKKKKRSSTNNTPIYIDVNAANQKRRYAAPPVVQREHTSFGGITEAISVEISARHSDKMNLGVIDNLLRQRKYRDFFSSSILKCTLNAEVTVATLQQLRIRQKLYVAMSGHSDDVLLQFLSFMKTNLFKGSFFYILYDVLQVFFTIYAEEQLSNAVTKSIEELKSAIFVEINLQKQLSKVLGIVSMLCFKSLDQKIRNAEKTNFDELEEQSNKMDIDKETVNGGPSVCKIDHVIIVNEKDANATAKKVEWNL